MYDIVMIAETNQDSQDITDAVHETSGQMRLKINMEKTKILAIDKGNTQMDIRVGDKKLELIEEFTYLGEVVTKGQSCEKDVQCRTGKASSVFTGLKKIWNDKHVTIQTNTILYEVFVLSVFVFGILFYQYLCMDPQKRS